MLHTWPTECTNKCGSPYPSGPQPSWHQGPVLWKTTTQFLLCSPIPNKPRPSTGPWPMGQDPCLTPWIFFHFLEVKIKISRCMQSTSITQACPTRISLYSASTWAWAPCSWVHYIFLCFCNLSFYFLRLDCSASFSCLSKPPLIIQSPFQIALTLIWYFLAQSSVTILWQPVRTFILHSQLASPILPSKTFLPLIQTPN